jgi:hypothetical protein
VSGFPVAGRTPLTRDTATGFEVGSVLRYGIAIASIAAGVVHLLAASAHTEHAPILGFFVGAGIAQILFGTAVISPRPHSLLLRSGALMSVGLIGVWAASRISGLPFVEGADHAEPIGVKDTAAVALELLVVIGALALVAGGRWLSMRLRMTERHLAPLAAATALIIAPGIVVPAHHHPHVHGETGHSHSEVLAAAHVHGEGAAGHEHGSALAGHAHAGDVTGHTHDAGHAHSATETTEVAAAQPAAATPAVTGIKASVRYGPFLMPPADAGGDAHYNRILTNVAKPCSNCYIVKATPNLVYADGSDANLDTGAMLHHAVWTRPSRPDYTCDRNSAIGSQGERFFASGNERTVMRLPAGFGYFVGTDSWTLIAEIMNHSDQARAMYVTLDVLYRPASDKLRKVTPVWMDIDNCGDSQYSIPAGRSNQLWTWESTITGRVVSTAGHVHNSGIKTVLTNETTHQEMCTSVAGYGKKAEYMGSIESMSDCVWDKIGIVREGEKLGLRAFYDSAKAQYDVMGINIAFVYETSDLAGGTTPPRSDAPREQSPPPSGGHDHGP